MTPELLIQGPIVKAQYLLDVTEGASLDDLLGATVAYARERWGSLEADPRSRIRVSKLASDVKAGALHAAMGGKPFPLVLEIVVGGSDLQTMTTTAKGLASAIGPTLDADQSCALVGPEYKFQPSEDGEVQLIVAVARPLTMSYEAFHERWLNGHGWLVKSWSDQTGSGYRQLHADPKASWLAAQAAGLGQHDYEGTGTGVFASVEAYAQLLGDPASVAPVLEDERAFVDHSASRPGLYETELLLG